MKEDRVLCDYEVDNIVGNGSPWNKKKINNRRKELCLEVKECE